MEQDSLVRVDNASRLTIGELAELSGFPAEEVRNILNESCGGIPAFREERGGRNIFVFEVEDFRAAAADYSKDRRKKIIEKASDLLAKELVPRISSEVSEAIISRLQRFTLDHTAVVKETAEAIKETKRVLSQTKDAVVSLNLLISQVNMGYSADIRNGIRIELRGLTDEILALSNTATAKVREMGEQSPTIEPVTGRSVEVLKSELKETLSVPTSSTQTHSKSPKKASSEPPVESPLKSYTSKTSTISKPLVTKEPSKKSLVPGPVTRSPPLNPAPPPNSLNTVANHSTSRISTASEMDRMRYRSWLSSQPFEVGVLLKNLETGGDYLLTTEQINKLLSSGQLIESILNGGWRGVDKFKDVAKALVSAWPDLEGADAAFTSDYYLDLPDVENFIFGQVLKAPGLAVYLKLLSSSQDEGKERTMEMDVSDFLWILGMKYALPEED